MLSNNIATNSLISELFKKLSSWFPLTFFTVPGAKSCARAIEALMWPPEQTAQ